MHQRARLLSTILLGIALAAGCSPEPPEPRETRPAAEPETATSRDFGDYILYFNALRTDQLTPEIARQHNIVRSSNRVLLNVSIVRKKEGSLGVPVSGSVSAQAVNLTGQLKNMTIREVTEGDAVYYIGDVGIGKEETLVFTVDATPINETSRFSVRFVRTFYSD
ncbi:MAG: DUF4426 domain-containing protein [Chromatiales bacterium]|nr:DUF4426 domain-containing protein [Chromatiales bacterium]